MTPSPHLEEARRISGFVWQTLCDRGIRCERTAIALALQELSPAQLASIHAAVLALAKGSDRLEDMELASVLRRVSAPALRQTLAHASICFSADVLLGLATGESTRVEFGKRTAQLQSSASAPDDLLASLESLRQLCGTGGSGVAAALSPRVASPPEDPLPPLPAFEPPVQAHWLEDEGLEQASAPQRPHASPLEAARPAAALAGAMTRQAKVFGKAGALTWETARLRQKPDRPSGATTTVMIEGADANHDGTYDWGNKLVFMCTLRELHQVLAVLMGWWGELELKFHGPDRKKSLKLEHQDHGLLVHLRHGTHNVRVPVDDADRYALSMLVLSALVSNEPHLDAQACLQVCRAMAAQPAFKRG